MVIHADFHAGTCACCGYMILGPYATISRGSTKPQVVCADSTDCRLRASNRMRLIWKASLRVRNAADASPNWMEPDAVAKHGQRLETEIKLAWAGLEAALD